MQNQFQAKGAKDAYGEPVFTDYDIVCWNDSHYTDGDQSTS